MFHLVAFSASVDSATLTPIAALADQALTLSGNDIVVPEDLPLLIAYYPFGVNNTRSQLVSPSLRRLFLEELMPIDRAALPPAEKHPSYLGDYALPLVADELLEWQAAEDAAGASRVTGLIWIADAPPAPIPPIDAHTVRVTSSTAAVANVWSSIPLTFDQSLPSGRYQLIGANLRSTNLQAFRFNFRGQAWRPGYIGSQAVGDKLPDFQEPGRMGVLGEFAHNLPPLVDVLANGADASYTGELTLIPI